MADKYRAGQVQGTLRLDRAFHEEVKLATVRQHISMKEAVETGLRMWLGHLHGDADLQKSVGPLTAHEQKWCIMLLSILRSKNHDATSGIKSTLVLYTRSVEIAGGPSS